MKKIILALCFTLLMIGCDDSSDKSSKTPKFNRNGIHSITKTKFDKEGYNSSGINAFGKKRNGEKISVDAMLRWGDGIDRDYIFYNDLIIDLLLKNTRDLNSIKSQFETVEEYNSRIKKEFELRKKSTSEKLNSHIIIEKSLEMTYNPYLKRWELHPGRNYILYNLSGSIGNNTSYNIDSYQTAYYLGVAHISNLELLVDDNMIVFDEPRDKAEKRGKLIVDIKFIVSSRGIKNPLYFKENKKRDYKNRLYTEYAYIIKTKVLGYQLKDSVTGEVLVKKSTEHQKEGLHKFYYENGKLRSEVNFKNGKQDGVTKFYYENGNLQQEENHKNGKAEGLTKGYYESGKLRVEMNFKNGKEEGLTKGYYESGKIQSEVNFKNDKQDGTAKFYYENGKLQQEENHKNGEINGLAKGYHENGKIQSERNYKNGKQEGVSKVYYENGELKQVENFKNGIRID